MTSPSARKESSLPFNEVEWMRLVFLLADTQDRLNELSYQTLRLIPVKGHKRLQYRSCYLSITALAHILQRHYCIQTHQTNTGRFSIPVAEMLAYLRAAHAQTPKPIPDSAHLQRVIHTTRTVGFAANGAASHQITVITDTGGAIVTVFPGLL